MLLIADCSEKGICLPLFQLHCVICILCFVISSSFICPIYARRYCSGSFLRSVLFRKPSTSGSLAIGSLRISIATLSITSHELNTCFISHLLYVSVSISISVSIPSSTSSTVYRTLVNSSATINLVHNSIISFLELTM